MARYGVGDTVRVAKDPTEAVYVVLGIAPEVKKHCTKKCGVAYPRYPDVVKGQHSEDCTPYRRSGAYWLQNVETGGFYRPNGYDEPVFFRDLTLVQKKGEPRRIDAADETSEPLF